MSDFSIYIYLLIALVVGIIIVKKVASCLFRIAFTIVFLVILAIVYYLYIMPAA